MSGTADSEQAAAADVARQASNGRWRARRRWVAAGAVVGVAAGVVAGFSVAAGRPGHDGGGSGPRTSTATVTRRSLSAQTQVAATLGDGGSYSAVNQAEGTITALPAVGQVVRQGQVLYQATGRPVVLLYGEVPAYRDLSAGMSGPDVAELDADLVALGDATWPRLGADSDYFSSETAYALVKLQARLGVPQTGTLALGQAVFLPGAIQVTGLGQGTVLGGPAQAGSVVLTASSTTPVVTIDLDAAQQTEVKDGQKVSITLPDNQVTPGVVSSVGTVATAPSSSSGGPAGSAGPSGSGNSLTITVQVTLGNPKAAGGLSQAPVTVTITTGSVSNALVVPVDALLARSGQGDGEAGGGYAVEVTSRGGHHHRGGGSVGLFDDAEGLVQVSGPGLAAGQRVVVPAT